MLGFALLGLIQQRGTASGYDLRKVFTQTPMGGYSDSPGAIYPALRRLEEKKLIQDTQANRNGLRHRKGFKLTATGMTELIAWLTRPLSREDITHRLPELMLRFAFLDGAAGVPATVRFLRSFEAELNLYIPTLRNYLSGSGPQTMSSARLALENGIFGYEAQLRWASHAIAFYEMKENLT